MVSKLALLAAGASTLGLVSAKNFGKAVIVNKCDFPITAGTSADGYLPRPVAANKGKYMDAITDVEGGKEIRIGLHQEDISSNKPRTSLSVTVYEGVVHYDLHDTFGDAFEGHKVELASADKDCDGLVWETGVPPGGADPSLQCKAGKNLVVTLCA